MEREFEMSEKNITFEIKEHLGVIVRFDNGWTRELNIISWNGGVPKFDLRDWDPHHERMRKGITLHAAEMRKVVDLYLSNNNRKAVEEGQQREEQRRERQRAQMELYNQNSQRTQSPEERGAVAAAVDEDSYEGALPPAQEVVEGADISADSREEAVETTETAESSGSADSGKSSETEESVDEQEETEFAAVENGDNTPF